MDRKLKIDTKSIKKTIDRTPEDYEPEIEKISYRKGITRTLVLLIGNFIGLVALVPLNIGISVDSMFTGAIVIISLSLINSFLWPIVSRVLMPFLLVTLGVGSFILNALLLKFLTWMIPGFTASGYSLFFTPLLMAIITTALSEILAVDDNSTYYRSFTKDALKRREDHVKRKKGMIILEIDGLAREILEEAIDSGYMPTLKSWIERGSHSITGWETDLSSQTGASQAGILHGNNTDIVAYRWVDKKNKNRVMSCGSLSDVASMEKKISDNDGLLKYNGAGRCNLFSGDSRNLIYVSSDIISSFKAEYNKAWRLVFSNIDSSTRIFVLFLEDVLLEYLSQARQFIMNVRPRISRGFIYAFIRAGASVILREINTKTLIWDMMDGELDIIYATYLGYDEIAHHSGIRDRDSFRYLKKLDKHFSRIEHAASYSKRKYEFVIQSDHGQSNGATFKQRNNGVGLDGLVSTLLPEDMDVFGDFDPDNTNMKRAYVPFSRQRDNLMDKYEEQKDNLVEKYEQQKENIRDKYEEQKDNLMDKYEERKDNIVEKYERQRDFLFERYSIQRDTILTDYDNELSYVNKYEPKKRDKKTKLGDSEAIVLASGNLGLIYFTQWTARLSYESIIGLFPDLIPGLVNNPYIGFILVDTEERGPIVISDKGVYYLDSDTYTGENPLKDFGENAADHLRRTNSFSTVPDILVNSFYDEENDEVAAFEELVGSHGGLGGTQTKPFIMHPSYWQINEDLIGARSIYLLLKRELENLKENDN